MTNEFFSVYLWISGKHQYLIYFLIYFIPTITLHFITMGDMLSAETGTAVWSVVLQMMDKIRAGPPVEQERLESQD